MSVTFSLEIWFKMICLTHKWSKGCLNERKCGICRKWWTHVGRELDTQIEAHFAVPAPHCCTLLIAGCPSFSPAAAHFHFHVAQPHSPEPHPSILFLSLPFQISLFSFSLLLSLSISSLNPLFSLSSSTDQRAISWSHDGYETRLL